MNIRKEDVLEYHASAPPGKISITPTKPCHTQRDLSLAYTPGVAIPCLEIQRQPALAYRYTAKGNLVAVVTDGTAVLGLGNIGPLAAKPVMEGKAVLFKRFADIDVFDVELNAGEPQDAPVQPAPVPQPPPQAETPQNQQPKTPEQLLQELQQMRQQKGSPQDPTNNPFPAPRKMPPN